MDAPGPQHRNRRRAGLAVVLAAVIAVVVVLVVVPRGSPVRHPKAAPSPAPRPQAPAGPPARPAPAGELLGVSVNRLFNDQLYSPAEIAAQLEALRQTGARVARSDAFWEAAEPNPPVAGVHHYDWTFSDRVAGDLAAHGIRWLPIIDYTAPWAQSVQGRDHSPPRSDRDYAAYAAAFAQRYGTGGSFWRAHPELHAEPLDTFEIWNEPDGSFWVPAPNARRYVDLYAAARQAITAVDQRARVIVGGLTNPQLFLPAMLSARPDIRGHIDGVGVHLYLPTPAAMVGAIRADRGLMDSLGMSGVPLYLTEFGWTVRPKGARFWIPERLRPTYIEETFAGLGHSYCGLAGVFLYTWITPERSHTNYQDWFGIHPPRGGSTADTQALADGIRAARAAPPRDCT